MPGAVDVTGTANTAATVTVNNQATARRADYFYKELALDNSAAPAYEQINVVGARNSFGAGGEDAVTEKGGRVFVPQAGETYTHDDDGNLTSDGRWNYTWDAENRLVSMEAIASVPPEAKQRLEFSYDYMARRVQKKLYVWNVAISSYQLQSSLKFVCEGWILNAELDGANALVRSYVWGQDLSGTLQGAGGIGGLLSIEEAGNSYQVGHDGNGNVVAVVNAGTGKAAASYDYDAFGLTLKAAGEYAQRNPFKFSTKYTDEETNLVYFGYRYYQPLTGRWLGQDPIEEEGGINLYAYVTNNPVSFTDPLGLWKPDAHAAIIQQTFRNCLTFDQMRQLQDASEYVDRIWGQQEALAYQHGMRGGPDESVEDARKGAADFMSGHLKKARSLAPEGCKSGCNKIPWDAIWEFGQALHTITDMTSPVHDGFQIWYGPPLPTKGYPADLFYSIRLAKWVRYAKWHGDQETLGVLGSDTGRLNRIKEAARNAFADTFGKTDECPCN